MADTHCVSPVTYTGMAVALIINRDRDKKTPWVRKQGGRIWALEDFPATTLATCVCLRQGFSV